MIYILKFIISPLKSCLASKGKYFDNFSISPLSIDKSLGKLSIVFFLL